MLWATGVIRLKTRVVEINYDKVKSVSPDGSDCLVVDGRDQLAVQQFR